MKSSRPWWKTTRHAGPGLVLVCKRTHRTATDVFKTYISHVEQLTWYQQRASLRVRQSLLLGPAYIPSSTKFEQCHRYSSPLSVHYAISSFLSLTPWSLGVKILVEQTNLDSITMWMHVVRTPVSFSSIYRLAAHVAFLRLVGLRMYASIDDRFVSH